MYRRLLSLCAIGSLGVALASCGTPCDPPENVGLIASSLLRFDSMYTSSEDSSIWLYETEVDSMSIWHSGLDICGREFKSSTDYNACHVGYSNPQTDSIPFPLTVQLYAHIVTVVRRRDSTTTRTVDTLDGYAIYDTLIVQQGKQYTMLFPDSSLQNHGSVKYECHTQLCYAVEDYHSEFCMDEKGRP